MKKLSEPDNSKASFLLTDIIKRKRNIDYAKRLTNYKNYIIKRYCIYEQKKHKLENIGASKIMDEEDKDAINSSFNKSFKEKMKTNELKKVYQECEGVCPYCGNEKIEEIDHYIPEKDYPEFILYPNNLIPSCNKCNKKKSNTFIDSKHERQFINFYYDNIDNIGFLSVKIDFDPVDIKKTTKVTYITDYSKIPDRYLRQIVEKHFIHLNLIHRYEDAASNEISELFEMLQNQDNKNADHIKIIGDGVIRGHKNTRLKKMGQDDWKYLLYEELIKIGYIDELIKYVCNQESAKMVT